MYGYARARQVIWTGFACNLLAVIAIWNGGKLPAAPFWTAIYRPAEEAQAAYEAILGYTPRDVLAQEATLPPPTWTRPNSPGWAADSDLPTRPPPSAQKGERRASAWAKTSTRIIS